MLVHSVLTGPLSLENIKELYSRSISKYSIADRQVLKKFEKNSDKGKTRVSEKSRMSQKKGIFSFLFKKSKSMSDLKNGELDEDQNNK